MGFLPAYDAPDLPVDGGNVQPRVYGGDDCPRGEFWSRSGEVLQVMMLIGCLLFPVIQPAAIYAKARRQAAAVPQDVRLTFDEKGLLVTTGGEKQHLPWNRLRVTKQRGMVLVLSGAGSGYMLTNRVLGAEREAFLSFAQSKVEQNR